MLVSLNQYRATVEIFNNHTFVCTSMCKNLFLVRNSQDFCLTDCTLHYSGKNVLFFILFLMLLISKHNACSGTKFFSASSFITVVINVLIAILYNVSISLSGDVQLNPGSKDKSSSVFSICRYNLNCIKSHSYAKVSLLEANIAAQKFDILCISETYPDSSTAYGDGNLEISGYNLIRSDQPSNKKGGGVCIYYKNSLPLRTNFLILFISIGL